MNTRQCVPVVILLGTMLLAGCSGSGAADAAGLSEDEQLKQQMQQVENEERARYEQGLQ